MKHRTIYRVVALVAVSALILSTVLPVIMAWQQGV